MAYSEPFPLEGEGQGWGVGAVRAWEFIGDGAASCAPRFNVSARTPAQPSPFEGEGS